MTINLAKKLNEEQLVALNKAAQENHFPYAKLLQALQLLNQKLPVKDQRSLLPIYDQAIGLLMPAALSGIPIAYQLLIGLQLNEHHPAGWPQLEATNRLLHQSAARESSSFEISVNGLETGGLLEQLIHNHDITSLLAIEQGTGKESELSEWGKRVFEILKALRKPDKERIRALKEIKPRDYPGLLQSIGLLKLLIAKNQEPAAKQTNSELWSYSLVALGLGSTSKKKNAPQRLLHDAPQVLVMSDLTAFKGVKFISALLKGNQHKEITVEHAGLWERYHALSLQENKDEIQSSFTDLFNAINTFPVEKARAALVEEWILARSFLSVRRIKQSPPVSLKSEAQTLESKPKDKSAKKKEKKKQQSDSVKKAGNRADSVTDKKSLAQAAQKTRQIVSEPLPLPTDERWQFLNLINYLDISLAQAIRSIEHNGMSRINFQNCAKIYADRAALAQSELDAFQAGYYYFLRALALLDAKMSSDNKIIKLTISPANRFNAEKIIESITEAERYRFPYASLLKYLFIFELTGDRTDATTIGYQSVMTGVSQGLELFMQIHPDASTLSGLLLKWLVQLQNRFELKTL